jgi:hypothetical protein
MTFRSTRAYLRRPTIGVFTDLPANHRWIRKWLGLEYGAKLPRRAIAPVEIQGIVVYVKPAVPGSRKHRTMAVCPDCGRHLSASRLPQHVCKEKVTLPRIVEGFDVFPTLSEEPWPVMVVQNERGMYEAIPGGCLIADKAFYTGGGYSDWCAENLDGGQAEGPPAPVFDCPEAAKKASQLCANYEVIADDLRAFNAPSECAPLAYKGFDNQYREDIDFVHAHCLVGSLNLPF